MAIRGVIAAVLAGAMCPVLAGCVLPPATPVVLASATGTGPDDAYGVSSVEQEYEILAALGLQRQSQRVHQIDGRPFDVLTAIDPQTEETRDVWFDISRFSGRL